MHDEENLGNLIKDVVRLIFHQNMLPSFLCVKNGLTEKPDNDAWAMSFAKHYVIDNELKGFFSDCSLHSSHMLQAESTELPIARFASRGLQVAKFTKRNAENTRSYLIDNEDCSHWLGLSLFCLSRALSTTATEVFKVNSWSKMSILVMELEISFVRADWIRFSAVLTKEYLPNFPVDKSLALQLCKGAATGLATMACLEPENCFFKNTRY